MKTLLVNQVFYPDEISVSQHMSDFACDCVAAGHQIDVIAGDSNYENPQIRYLPAETWNTISIKRLSSTRFTKKSLLGRLINFITFNFNLFFRLICKVSKKYDVVIASTVPPMIGIFTAVACLLKRRPFVYWIMDLQPDEAIAAGILKSSSMPARLFSALSMLPLKQAQLIVVLDRFMKERIIKKKISPNKIAVIPPWPVILSEKYSDEGRTRFRDEHGFGNRLVVLYSGNHSICHPLDTFINAVISLKDDPRFLFVSIGGGVRVKDVEKAINDHQLKNLIRLPFQPRERLNDSLCAADVHVVVMGDPFVGIVHPNKQYSSMALGIPFLFVGPKQSHLGDIIDQTHCGFQIEHGDDGGCVKVLRSFAAMNQQELRGMGSRGIQFVKQVVDRSVTSKVLVTHLENLQH